MFMVLFFGQWPVALIATFLLFRSARRKSGASGLCMNCGYDLRGTPSGVCSECGHNTGSGAANRGKESPRRTAWVMPWATLVALAPPFFGFAGIADGFDGLASLYVLGGLVFMAQALILRAILNAGGRSALAWAPLLLACAAVPGFLLSFLTLVTNR